MAQIFITMDHGMIEQILSTDKDLGIKILDYNDLRIVKKQVSISNNKAQKLLVKELIKYEKEFKKEIKELEKTDSLYEIYLL